MGKARAADSHAKQWFPLVLDAGILFYTLALGTILGNALRSDLNFLIGN